MAVLFAIRFQEHIDEMKIIDLANNLGACGDLRRGASTREVTIEVRRPKSERWARDQLLQYERNGYLVWSEKDRPG